MKRILWDEAKEYYGRSLNARLMTLDLTQWWANRADKLASNLRMKKPRPWQITGLVQGHPARKLQNQADLNSTDTWPVPSHSSGVLDRIWDKQSRNGGFALWHSQGTRLCPSSYPHTFKRKIWGSRPTLKSEDPSSASCLATPMRLQWPGYCFAMW